MIPDSPLGLQKGHDWFPVQSVGIDLWRRGQAVWAPLMEFVLGRRHLVIFVEVL